MRVLSLFDGMSCGQIALKEIGITPEVYYASEIDKFAIKQTQLNFPNTIQVGDVRDLNVENLGHIDLILAGSPCTDMSFSGKRKGLSTVEGIEIKSLNEYLELKKQGFEFAGQSYLFWEFIRILNDVRKTNPDVLFLLENVKMGKKWEPVFDNAIGCKGNHINSALVSAQTRKRIYWTNIQGGIIPQPKDEGLTISDISEYEVDEKYYLSEKVLNNLAFHLKRNHDKGNCYGANIKTKDEKSNTVTVKGKYMYDLICVAMRGRNPEKPTCRESGLKTVQMIEFKNDGKSNCLTTVQKDLGIEVITHEESYTSKIDHLAFEPLKKQESYLGKRKKRGLFQSSIGKLINADINGSIGIARKVVGDSFIGKIIDSGFVFNPVRINIL